MWNVKIRVIGTAITGNYGLRGQRLRLRGEVERRGTSV